MIGKDLPFHEQQYEAARKRLWERGISCPSKEEVNEEIDLYNSPVQQHVRNVNKKYKSSQRK